MVDFTNDELLAISSWAFDAADKARAGKIVNIYRYEQAKQIHQKVHDEYCKRVKEEKEG